MKPSLPSGFRDFSPEQVYKREYIMATLKDTFLKFGYAPIETPTMEKLSTITGKYGEEGDRLLFKVLNQRVNEARNKEELSAEFQKSLEKPYNTEKLTERALRYDLTIPFARYVVMHQNDLQFPFKRYQIQPVWRGDSPQKGRYREFYQCDVDVVGSTSLLYEAELLQIYDQAFTDLGVEVTIKYSNRKILAGLAEVAGISDFLIKMTVIIDKLDKIGAAGVEKELQNANFSDESVAILLDLLKIKNFTDLKAAFANSEIGLKGIAELEEMLGYLPTNSFKNTVEFDITLARGLDYYTGFIAEVKANKAQMGSIGGGGRYDDLTGSFGLKGVSGVGVSFGLDRIYDVMEELGLFQNVSKNAAKILFLSMSKEALVFAFQTATKLRTAGIACDIYPEPKDFKKQMKYANARGFSYVGIIGEEELKVEMITLKNMETGEQERVSVERLSVLWT